jgi:pyruvate,water dikinase
MDEFVISLADERALELPIERAGGKALYLARLIAGGARIPRGFVVAADAPATDATTAAIDDAAASLSGDLAVRSSASIEDTALAAAPGIFDSRIGVARADLHEAIEAVRASGRGDIVAAYAGALGIDTDSITVAVVVHELVVGAAAGTVYTRPPGTPTGDRLSIEVDSAGAEVARQTLEIEARDERFPLSNEVIVRIARDALAAERIIRAADGADIEFVVDSEQVISLVQARPIVHPEHAAMRPSVPAMWLAFSRDQPERVWRWDAAHNPDPLSPAQIGLVEAMDRAGIAGYAMRVVAGHLYTSGGRVEVELPATSTALRERFDGQLAPAMVEALRPLQADAPAPIAEALGCYEAFYAIYAGQLTPLLGAARTALTDLVDIRLAGELLADGSSARLETLIAAAARGDIEIDELLRTAGPMASAWDVAAPTLAETPDVLRDAVASYRPREPIDTSAPLARARALGDEGFRVMVDEALAFARAARDIGEVDDRLYARAQAGVRRSLLALADTWRLIDRDDIFFVPLTDVLELAARDATPAPDVIHKMARAARAARERQRQWTMPVEFSAGEAKPRGLATLGPGVYAGRGTGGRVAGTVARIADLETAETPPDDSVLLVRAITPAMTFLMQRCAAVVSTHGGLLGHGAAIARELGVPCVVGCTGAWSELRDGDRVLVDGDAGVVVRSPIGDGAS